MNLEDLSLFFYCRAGYESDLLAELDHKLGLNQVFGYGKFSKDCGFLRYYITSLPPNIPAKSFHDWSSQALALSHIMFARQKTYVFCEVVFDNREDRITNILASVKAMLASHTIGVLNRHKVPFGDIKVEYPDTEDGKQMAKFCKKFTVPLRNALRQAGFLSKAPQTQLPYLHLFFEQGTSCLLSLSLAGDRSENLLGIKRLKFPSDAPSRSTLKLEEAISEFCDRQQSCALFVPGMTAVDLGACPGGWTYQLVSRGLHVEAIDNGAMDEKLMATGLVDYQRADGFKYLPKQGHVDWLVCDMIEQPDKVANLIMTWLSEGLASAAIFNLKLPMKKRFQTLQPIIEQFERNLIDHEQTMYMRAKHLYHNRDEVSFMLIKNSYMQSHFITQTPP